MGSAAARLRLTGLPPSSLAEAFGLGVPTGPLVAVTGGPSAVHRSARLSTSRGRFAVKVLGRGHAHDAEALEGPVRLELAALAAGVPVPRPCLAVATGAGVAAVAGPGGRPVLVRVHEWVEATAPAAPAPAWLAGPLGAALPLLAEVAAVVAARAAEPVALVVTHCDLVPGNVLVSAGERPWIVDWDDAGPWSPAEEVAAAVVSWSSGARGEPDERVALALVEGYRQAGGDFRERSPTVLAGSLSAVANWLELNVRRSLREAAGRPLRARAEAEVAAALGELARRLAVLDRWMALLR